MCFTVITLAPCVADNIVRAASRLLCCSFQGGFSLKIISVKKTVIPLSQDQSALVRLASDTRPPDLFDHIIGRIPTAQRIIVIRGFVLQTRSLFTASTAKALRYSWWCKARADVCSQDRVTSASKAEEGSLCCRTSFRAVITQRRCQKGRFGSVLPGVQQRDILPHRA